jgi:hypothetical protein
MDPGFGVLRAPRSPSFQHLLLSTCFMSWDSQMGCTLFAPFGSPAASSSVPLGRGPWLCVPASRRVCLFVDVLVTTIYAIRRGKNTPPGHSSTEMKVVPEARGSSTRTSSPHYSPNVVEASTGC